MIKTLKLILENDTKPFEVFDYHVIVMDECQYLDIWNSGFSKKLYKTIVSKEKM